MGGELFLVFYYHTNHVCVFVRVCAMLVLPRVLCLFFVTSVLHSRWGLVGNKTSLVTL
jgi:hypothetical protein